MLPPKPPVPEPAKLLSGPDAAPSVRFVAYGERDIVPIKAKLRHTTMIVLPKDEQNRDGTIGDAHTDKHIPQYCAALTVAKASKSLAIEGAARDEGGSTHER